MTCARTPVKGSSVIGRNTQGVRLAEKEEDEGNVVLLTDIVDDDNGGDKGAQG